MKKLFPKLFIMFFFCTGCAGFALPAISPSVSGGGGQQSLLQTSTTIHADVVEFTKPSP